MDLKILAVDIDGTLTENGEIIDIEALSILRSLTNLGYKIVLVSGRSSIEGYILATFGGLTRIAVGENGGVVTTSPTNHILLVDKSYSEKAYELLAKHIPNVRKKDVFPRLSEVVLERTFDIKEGEKILEENDLPITIVDSMYAYHLNHKNINKSVGFKVVLDMFNMSYDNAIAIGDSDTDIPLFKSCAYSIALGNSTEGAKRNAKYVVKNKNGKGLKEAIDHILNML